MTGWNRRSRAASFSMCLRYSSSVVAPMQCNSPRASIGLSRLPASIAPSALPAPTTVCSSSMNRMMSPSALCTSLRTAFSRSSNSLGQPLDDRGLADARLADQHRVVLGAPRKHLDHPPDLLVPPDHRVELPRRGQLRQITAILLQSLV